MRFFTETLALSFLMVVHMAHGDDPHEGTRAKCRAEFGLTEDEVNEGATSPQPRLGCYLKCLFLDVGIMTSQGIVLPERLIMELGHDARAESEAIIFSCAEEINGMEDACEASFQFWECFRKKIPETFANLGIYGKPAADRSS